MAYVKTIRERILDYLIDSFANQQEGVPPGVDAWGNPTEYDFTWDVVQREPLTDRERKKRFALAIIEQSEQKNPQTEPCTHSFMQLTFEFFCLVQRDESPAEITNMILGNIQRRLKEDITAGGLSYNIREVGNDIDIDAWADRQIDGVVNVAVLFKHATVDPRRLV